MDKKELSGQPANMSIQVQSMKLKPSKTRQIEHLDLYIIVTCIVISTAY